MTTAKGASPFNTLLVCGGRGFGRNFLYLEGEAWEKRKLEAEKERSFLAKALSEIDQQFGPFTNILHGGAKGADHLAAEWARDHGKNVICVAADWDSLGKAAGPARNQKMLDEHHPEMVVAFSGGKGTMDMLERSLKTDALVIQFRKTPKAGEQEWMPIRLSLNGL